MVLSSIRIQGKRQIIEQRDDITRETEYVFSSANNDFDQLQVKTADGNDGNAMLRLGSQTVFWQAFIGLPAFGGAEGDQGSGFKGSDIWLGAWGVEHGVHEFGNRNAECGK